MHFIQRSADDSEILSIDENQPAFHPAMACHDAFARSSDMFHSEFTAPVFHKGIDLDKAFRIQERVDPLAGGFLALPVLGFHLCLASAGNDLGAAPEKILHLVIHRFF